jgi:hypothetical protein
MTARILILVSALIVFLLGSLHMAYTFFTGKFDPRDADLRARLDAVSPVITKQTTFWRAGIGFHASHSAGVMFFGVLYAWLAMAQPALLFGSPFLASLGLVLLLHWLVLAHLYWFSIPFRGIALALACYVAGWAVALT